MEQSSLNWRIQSIILILILLLHGSLLIMLFIAHLESTQTGHEAIVMIDPDELQQLPSMTAIAQHDPLPALPTALPTMPAAAPIKETPPPAPKPLDPLPATRLDSMPNLAAANAQQKSPEKIAEPSLDHKIDEALALAQQMLNEEQEKPAPIVAQKVAEKPETIADNSSEEEKESDEGTAPLKASTTIAQLIEKKEASKDKKEPVKQANNSATENKDKNLAEFSYQSSPMGAKKNLSLAQLTQGFVGHLEQAAMAVRGNHSGAATAEQLKQINFCQKILNCVVNSYKIQRMNMPNNHREMKAARILLVLNDNGSINALEMHQSSGNVAVDNFLLELFRDASSSFPPVPASFNQKTYMLPVFNIDHLEALQSSKNWYIDNKA